MSVANLLYDRPDLNQGLNRPPLTLTGVLSRASPGEAYSGFLSIGNGIGNSAVIATSGDLPNGTAVVVNNTTQRVEVSWPAYVPPTSGGAVVSVDVPNGNFEQGDVFWQKGAGWTIGTGASESPETRAGLYTGPKTSVMWHAGAFPTRGGNTVRLRLRASGNESGNSSSCQAIVAFYGASGFISQDWSKVGADENFFEWDDFSTVAPEGALYYHIGVIGTKRRYSPRPATVDRVLLDATANTDTPDIGINIEATLGVTISIQDDADRIATWSGNISVSLWNFTWQPRLLSAGGFATIGGRGGWLIRGTSNSVHLVDSDGALSLTQNPVGGQAGIGFTDGEDAWYVWYDTATAFPKLLRSPSISGPWSTVFTGTASEQSSVMVAAFDDPNTLVGIGRPDSPTSWDAGRRITASGSTRIATPALNTGVNYTDISDMRSLVRHHPTQSYWAVSSSNNGITSRVMRSYTGFGDWAWLPLTTTVIPGSGSGAYCGSIALSEDLPDVMVLGATDLQVTATHPLLRVSNIHGPGAPVETPVALPASMLGSGSYWVVWHRVRRQFICVGSGKTAEVAVSDDGITWYAVASAIGDNVSPDAIYYNEYDDTFAFITQSSGFAVTT